jgi:hypothetical protein
MECIQEIRRRRQGNVFPMYVCLRQEEEAEKDVPPSLRK